MSHVWTSRIKHTYKSCHTYEWFVSHTWHVRVIVKAVPCAARDKAVPCDARDSHAESWHTHEWVMSKIMAHTWMSHVSGMNEKSRIHETYKYQSYVKQSGVLLASMSNTDECVMSHRWVCHVTRMNQWCGTYECVAWHIKSTSRK